MFVGKPGEVLTIVSMPYRYFLRTTFWLLLAHLDDKLQWYLQALLDHSEAVIKEDNSNIQTFANSYHLQLEKYEYVNKSWKSDFL